MSLFKDGDEENFWFTGIEGIVAVNDDPERRCRVQCKIPLLDESEVYQVWARRISLFVGGAGYGDFHYPEIGTEVVLWGRMNDERNLFYAPIFNEDYPVPSDFQNLATRGFRNDGDYKMITEGNLYIRAGRILIEADSIVQVIAPAGFFQQSKPE